MHVSFDNLINEFTSCLKFIQYALVCPLLCQTYTQHSSVAPQLAVSNNFFHHLSLGHPPARSAFTKFIGLAARVCLDGSKILEEFTLAIVSPPTSIDTLACSSPNFLRRVTTQCSVVCVKGVVHCQKSTMHMHDICGGLRDLNIASHIFGNHC